MEPAEAAENVSRSIFSSATWEQFAKKPKSDPDPSITRINPEIGLVSKWVLFTVNGEHYWFNFRISPTFPDVS